MLGNTKGRLLNKYVPDYVLYDLETTGISCNYDEVIEISAIRVRNGSVDEEFSSLVNPGRPIPYAASSVNHITDDMVAGSPDFAEVLQEGTIHPGDTVITCYPDENRPFQAAVITLSDKGAKGERVDESGPAAKELLEQAGYEVVETMILPDEPAMLKTQLMRLADGRQLDLVLTSGGTGFSLRDQTPEATMAVADRNAPGIAEAIRYKSMAVTDRAMLSRGVSVIRKKTLIVNLPGSPKAVKESLGFILDSLDHGLKILRGSAYE